MTVRRNTFQKFIVLQTVHDMKCPASADEEYDVIKKPALISAGQQFAGI